VSSIQGTTVVVRDPDMIAAEMDGDVVMMSIERGEYFGIGGVGTRLWELVEEPRSVDDLCAAICREYEVDEGTCRRDVSAFVEELLGRGLLQTA
jgi:hypothetical protein